MYIQDNRRRNFDLKKNSVTISISILDFINYKFVESLIRHLFYFLIFLHLTNFFLIINILVIFNNIIYVTLNF